MRWHGGRPLVVLAGLDPCLGMRLVRDFPGAEFVFVADLEGFHGVAAEAALVVVDPATPLCLPVVASGPPVPLVAFTPDGGPVREAIAAALRPRRGPRGGHG